VLSLLLPLLSLLPLLLLLHRLQLHCALQRGLPLRLLTV
jgi:hypothetical protein